MSEPAAEMSRYKPKTVYVTYIVSTPEKVWQALTDPAFTKRYFGGLEVDVEPRAGGAFRLLFPDGRVHVSGHVVDWSPPKRFACTWVMEAEEFRGLPECLVTYEIDPAGDAVRLTMTEAHTWDVPDAILAGGNEGWPAILSGLKSLLETGDVPAIQPGMPDGFVEAVRKAIAEKPWLNG